MVPDYYGSGGGGGGPTDSKVFVDKFEVPTVDDVKGALRVWPRVRLKISRQTETFHAIIRPSMSSEVT